MESIASGLSQSCKNCIDCVAIRSSPRLESHAKVLISIHTRIAHDVVSFEFHLPLVQSAFEAQAELHSSCASLSQISRTVSKYLVYLQNFMDSDSASITVYNTQCKLLFYSHPQMANRTGVQP